MHGALLFRPSPPFVLDSLHVRVSFVEDFCCAIIRQSVNTER